MVHRLLEPRQIGRLRHLLFLSRGRRYCEGTKRKIAADFELAKQIAIEAIEVAAQLNNTAAAADSKRPRFDSPATSDGASYNSAVSQSSYPGPEHNVTYVASSLGIRKSDTESCRNTLQLFALPKEDMLHGLYGGSISNSQALAAGHGLEEKHLPKKEHRVPRASPGCFKTPRTPQMEMSMPTAAHVVMKDSCEMSLSLILERVPIQEDYPRLSALAAGQRKFDVYMGWE